MSLAPLFGQLFRFGCVGTVGFVVDGGLLFMLVRAGVDPLLARAVSFPVAVTVTWQLNRAWTFAMSREQGRQGRRYARYFLVQGVGALCNYVFYAASLGLTGTSPTGALYALAIGSIVGLAVNFTGARLLVFTAS